MTDKEISALFSKAGIRVTQQRIAVYSYLYQNRIHPTAETVYTALVKLHPSFSLTTVYNSLHVLENAGLIRSLTIDSDEQRFDANPFDHGHFKCIECGKIYDIKCSATFLSEVCPEGCVPQIYNVYIKGICSNCVKADAKK
ncbi:MAG: transcriptional repressor [Clostridiales bacterium]|nr:transcriptional repressor [Clostridiales bacterium]